MVAGQQAALDLESDRAMKALAVSVGAALGGAIVFDDAADRAIVRRFVGHAAADLQKPPTFEETAECFAVGGSIRSILAGLNLSQ